jgi:hypothetical protein
LLLQLDTLTMLVSVNKMRPSDLNGRQKTGSRSATLRLACGCTERSRKETKKSAAHKPLLRLSELDLRALAKKNPGAAPGLLSHNRSSGALWRSHNH